MSNIKEKVADTLNNIKSETKTAIEYLDVGEFVGKAVRFKEKLSQDSIKDKIYDFRDNAKYDGIKSAGRTVKDFVSNYPVYFLQGVVGSIKDKFEKK